MGIGLAPLRVDIHTLTDADRLHVRPDLRYDADALEPRRRRAQGVADPLDPPLLACRSEAAHNGKASIRPLSRAE